MTKTTIMVMCIVTAGFVSAVNAAVFTEDFETSSGSTPPAGWTLMTYAGSPTYGTAAGSDGAGGDASGEKAGQVFSSDFDGDNVDLPGAYLMNSTVFDMTSELTVTFDFRFNHEGRNDDSVFVIGDIADGFSDISAGELMTVKFQEADPGIRISDGFGGDPSNSQLENSGSNSKLSDDTWYRGTFTWTPTSSTTGNASFTLNNFSADVYTLSTTNFTFDSANAQIGFGSVNDNMVFDNVSVTGTEVTSSGVDLHAYQAADGVYVEFTAYDVEADGIIMLVLVDAEGNELWSGEVEVTAGPQSVARFLVPGLELGESYDFLVRDEVGKWWEADGVTVGSFDAEMTSATLAGITVTFDSLPGNSYDIQWTADLEGTWQTITNVTAAASQTSVVVDPPAGSETNAFFRVQAQ